EMGGGGEWGGGGGVVDAEDGRGVGGGIGAGGMAGGAVVDLPRYGADGVRAVIGGIVAGRVVLNFAEHGRVMRQGIVAGQRQRLGRAVVADRDVDSGRDAAGEAVERQVIVGGARFIRRRAGEGAAGDLDAGAGEVIAVRMRDARGRRQQGGGRALLGRRVGGAGRDQRREDVEGGGAGSVERIDGGGRRSDQLRRIVGVDQGDVVAGAVELELEYPPEV